ncbi:MAG: c-type cytochrome [Gemmatimonadota bacterium]|nr:c-type cytochrome [Gemmatimonadota bacterium]
MTSSTKAGWTVPVVPLLGLVLGCGGGDSGGSAETGTGGAGEPAEAAPVPAAAEERPAIDESLLPEGVTVAMVEEGRDLFSGGGVCHTCHLKDGTGGPLAPDLTDDRWINVDGEYESIVELVKTGVPEPVEHAGAMLPRAGMALTDAQVEALAAYAYMLSRM